MLHSVNAGAMRLFGAAKNAAYHIDKGLGAAARVYHAVAPILEPLAREHLGAEKTHQIHSTISSGIRHYAEARSHFLNLPYGKMSATTRKIIVDPRYFSSGDASSGTFEIPEDIELAGHEAL